MRVSLALVSLSLAIPAPVVALPQHVISKGAMATNSIPCSHRGGSNTNCQHNQQANPPNRGCEAEERCRSEKAKAAAAAP
ncbi:hypothetical protein Vi05172_g8942 [Venturia inaequalis]|nr:hypothetical protein Vi05172_g8942 [Venturia inaequalis]